MATDADRDKLDQEIITIPVGFDTTTNEKRKDDIPSTGDAFVNKEDGSSLIRTFASTMGSEGDCDVYKNIRATIENSGDGVGPAPSIGSGAGAGTAIGAGAEAGAGAGAVTAEGATKKTIVLEGEVDMSAVGKGGDGESEAGNGNETQEKSDKVGFAGTKEKGGATEVGSKEGEPSKGSSPANGVGTGHEGTRQGSGRRGSNPGLSKIERRKLRVLKNRESAMRSLQKKAARCKELAAKDKLAKEKLEKLRTEATEELNRLKRMMFPFDEGGIVVNEHRTELKRKADEMIVQLENEIKRLTPVSTSQ